MELLLAQGDDNLEVPHVPIPLSKNTANHNSEKFLPTILFSAIAFWNLSTTLFALFLNFSEYFIGNVSEPKVRSQ